MSSDAARTAQAELLVGLRVVGEDAVGAQARVGQAEARRVPHDVVVRQDPRRGAPTSSFACSDAAITVRSGAAAHPVVRNEKLNAWCISSGRT